MTPDDSYWNPDFTWPPETSVAFATRLRFVAEALRTIGARNVLDVGCGTGELLTAWLAELCPHCQFLGVDSDPVSIEHARQTFANVPNLQFALEPPVGGSYDAVIASEVLEHVTEPYAFLDGLRGQLRPDGRLILTTPNGYGCSEWMSLLETLLILSGSWDGLRSIKRTVFGQSARAATRATDTRAVSPHVNFFGLGRLRRMFRETSLEAGDYRGRMFLHNFLCTMLIDRSRLLAELNAWLGRRLPAWLVSDWMFVLKVNGSSAADRIYRRNAYESVKRYLNLKRFGMLY